MRNEAIRINEKQQLTTRLKHTKKRKLKLKSKNLRLQFHNAFEKRVENDQGILQLKRRCLSKWVLLITAGVLVHISFLFRHVE